jgi:hypothetical protein
MSGMENQNFLYSWKLTIVVPVSSTLPKDGFKPALRERAFFCPIPAIQRKNPPSLPMRASLSSRFPSHGTGFCERIMRLNGPAVYVSCIFIQTEKGPLNRRRRAWAHPLGDKRTNDGSAGRPLCKSAKRFSLQTTRLSLRAKNEV